MHLYLIALALALVGATPIDSPNSSPAMDMGKLLFKRQRDCGTVRCANVGGAGPIPRAECRWFNCGLCTPQGVCLPDPGDGDSYDPSNPGDPYGGAGGGASNGGGSQDSSSTCADGSATADDAGSCPVNGSGAGGSTTGVNPPGTQAASCGGSCSTSDNSACGSGCGCTFAGTGAFGGLDGSCAALVSFGGSG